MLSADALQAFPPVHAGYKGLFADRLDVPVAETSTTGTAIIGEPPRCVPFAAVLYQNRNRTYAPGLGRFMQQDPNATAMVLMESAAYHGRGIGAVVAAFSAEQMYGDGGNLYQYLGSNPGSRSDPMGLWMWGGYVDTFSTGARVFALAYAALETYQFIQQ